MAVLQTPQEFVAAVRRGRVVDLARLKGFLAAARWSAATSARRVADRAVAAGLLTRYQADEVLGGRTERLVVGDYRLLARLGAGGTGDVFLAEHAPTGERRAVKVLHDDQADDPVARQRLGREAGAVAVLSHPNLVGVFEFDPGGDGRPPFLAMEYVDGVSLQAAVALAGTFTAEAAAECGRQAADALQHAWDAGLVHRDVKPANLLLSRGGRVKVVDFGLVRVSGNNAHSITGRRAWLGTTEYAAPEQLADGSAVDCRADVYALGSTLYFLLAGHPPFDHGTWADRLQDKLTADPTPIHRLRPDVPEDLSAVIAAMLARKPAARPPTPAVAARLLARWTAPHLAADLFARLARPSADTLPEMTPIPPDPEAGKGSTAELLPCIRPPSDPRVTIRIPRPSLILPRHPSHRLWWVLAALAVLIVVVAVIAGVAYHG
jgi:serine/threonine protein kinase